MQIIKDILFDAQRIGEHGLNVVRGRPVNRNDILRALRTARSDESHDKKLFKDLFEGQAKAMAVSLNAMLLCGGYFYIAIKNNFYILDEPYFNTLLAIAIYSAALTAKNAVHIADYLSQGVFTKKPNARTMRAYRAAALKNQ